MAAIQGYGGYVVVGTSTAVNIKQWELPMVAEKYDVSAINQTTPVWKSYIPGLLGADAKIDAFWDTADTNGQMALQSSFLNATTVTLVLHLSSSHYYTGTAYITGLDVKVPVNGPQECAIAATITGSVVYT